MVDSVKTGWMPRYSAKDGGRVRVAHPVDVGQRQTGVLEGLEHHGHLELAPGALQLAGGGDVVGHADDGGRAAQGAIDPAHDAPTPRFRPDLRCGPGYAFFGSSEKGVVLSLLGSLGRPSTRSPMMLRWTWSVPP